MNETLSRRGRAFLVALLGTALSIAALPAVAEPRPEATNYSEHFSITWVTDQSDPDAPDLTDADADGVPDAVEAMIAAFEAARAFELDELGYREPPNEDRYPLYIAQGAVNGYTQPLPGGTGRSRPSFIAVPPRFVQASVTIERMKTFAAHEYMHAIQLGYDYGEDGWIGEATSTWVEDRVVDDANSSHLQLAFFLPYPRMALEQRNGSHEYGAFLFLQFLTERYGGGSIAGSDLVRELWEKMAVPEAIPGAPDMSSLEAIEALLQDRGVSLTEAWAEFLLWNRQLARYEEGASYKTAVKRTPWPSVLRTSETKRETCRLTMEEGGGLVPLSGDYVVLKPAPRGPDQIEATLTLVGPPGTTAYYSLRPLVGDDRSATLTFDAAGVATAALPFGTAETRRIVAGVGNGNRAGDEIDVAYSLRLAGRSRVTVDAPTGASTTFYGTATSLSGSVTCGAQPAPFAAVEVTETEVVSGATRTYRATTDQFGRWTTGVGPKANASYGVEVIDPLLSSDSAGDHALGVMLAVTGGPTQSEVFLGSPVTFAGQVFPTHAGAPVVIEYQRPEGIWQTGAATTVDAQGGYSAEVVLPADGVWELRARVTDTLDEDHLPGGTPGRFVTVSP